MDLADLEKMACEQREKLHAYLPFIHVVDVAASRCEVDQMKEWGWHPHPQQPHMLVPDSGALVRMLRNGLPAVLTEQEYQEVQRAKRETIFRDQMVEAATAAAAKGEVKGMV